MLLIVPDAGERNDFQMRRFFLSLEHSCTWNANFNQLFDGEICNKSAISAGFPFIPVSAVGWCPLEETWIVCKIIETLCNNLVAGTIYLSYVLIYLITAVININNDDKRGMVGKLCFTGFFGEVEYL